VLEIKSDPYSILFGMRSPKTREKCIGLLRIFFDSITEDNMELRCHVFYEKIRSESGREWVLANIIKSLQFQKEKFEEKEITASTVKNYYQDVKLFSEMNGISIPVP
jgi:hypothetical protein